MPSDIDPNLEAFIHDRLRRLPPRSAPSTLAPGVMAALRARAAQPWWRRAWWEWPLAAKAALVSLALVALGVASGGNFFLGDVSAPVSQFLSHQYTVWTSLWASMTGPADTFGGYWTRFVEPLVAPALVASLLLYLVSMGCGTALVRLAWKRS